jgi:transcriptional regulator with XRE-family HTH domain
MPEDVNGHVTLVELVAANVRRLLRKKQMPAARLAAAMGVSRQYIYLIRAGLGNLTLETLEQLAGGLGVKPEELFGPVRGRDRFPEKLPPGLRRLHPKLRQRKRKARPDPGLDRAVAEDGRADPAEIVIAGIPISGKFGD